MKLKLLLLLFPFFLMQIFGQQINFPDPKLKEALLDHHLPDGSSAIIDTNHDGEIQISEAQNYVGVLNLENKSISNYAGLENFISISELHCGFNQAVQIDLTQFGALQKFNALGGLLQTVDLSKNTQLQSVQVSFSQVSSLIFQNNWQLQEVFADECQLSNIDFTGASRITHLNINANFLQNIDVSGLSNLQTINLSMNQLTSIDLQQNTVLENLNIDGNNLSSIDLTGNPHLKNLSVANNSLTEISLALNPFLTHLNANENLIQDIDLNNQPNLEFINLNHNKIKTFDIRENAKVSSIDLNNNQLETLLVSNANNPNFTFMNAGQNPILKCIQIDPDFSPGPNWHKDETAVYSSDCSLMQTQESSQKNVVLVSDLSGDKLWVKGIDPRRIELLDLNGRKILSADDVTFVNVSHLSAGFYFVKITTAHDGNFTLKWIKR